MKQSKRALAVLLSLLMVFTCLTGAVSAAGKQRTEGAIEKQPFRTGKAGTGEEQTLPEARQGKGRGFQSLSFRTENAYQYADDEIVTAIVLLQGAPIIDQPAEQRGAAALRLAAQHNTLRRDMDAASVSYAETFEYTTLLNGMAIRVAYGDLETVAALRGVDSIHIANHYAPPEVVEMESSNEMTGAAAFQAGGWKGSGTVIAVLDTGITPEHEAFGVYAGMLKQAALSEANARAAIGDFGYGTYLSQKIPFSYDYADQDDDATDDSSGHGTHVSGIALGYAETPDGAVSFTGTAPDAQLLAMKIFGSEEEGTDSSIYFAALEDAYLLGADVINMSIGAQNGFTYDKELEDEVFGDIYQKLYEAGVAVVVAAGNEGSMADGASNWAGPGYVTSDYADYGVVGSPSTYGNNLSVASAENAEYPVNYLLAEDRQIIYYDAYAPMFLNAFGGMENVEFAVVPNYGDYADYAGLAVEGRIALVSRGETTFQEKLDAAASAGAVGLLVYNNEPGTIYMAIDDYRIPAATISQEDGEYLRSIAVTEEPFAVQPATRGSRGLEIAKVTSCEGLLEGQYILVNEQTGRVFNAGAGADINKKYNYLTLEEATEAASLTLNPATGSLRTADGKYITGTAGANSVSLSDNEVPNDISFDDYGNILLVNNETRFAYNADWEGFRFYKNASPLLDDDRSAVALYRIGGEPAEAAYQGTFTAADHVNFEEDGNLVVLYNPVSGMALSIEPLTGGQTAMAGKPVEVVDGTAVDPPVSAVWVVSVTWPAEAGEPVHLTFRDFEGNKLSMDENGLVLNGEESTWNSHRSGFTNAWPDGGDEWTLFNLINDADDKYGIEYPDPQPEPDYLSLVWDEDLGGFTTAPLGADDAFVFEYLLLDPDPTPPPVPAGNNFFLGDWLGDGDKVVIYNPDSGMAMSSEADGYYRAGVEVTPENGILTDPDPALVWEVSHGDNRGLVLTGSDGGVLSIQEGYNSLPSDQDYYEWYLDFALDSSEDLGAYVINQEAPAGDNGDPRAIEYYRGHFTAYFLNRDEDSAFRMQLYIQTPAVEPVPTDVGLISFPTETIIVDNPAGWQMSSFSSWGVTPELALKPMITGIGGNVNSAAYGTVDGYTVMSGTSMATPNLSGAMADVLQYLQEKYPDLARAERLQLAEALLESSACILTDEYGGRYSPRKQGAGLVDLRNLTAVKAYVTEPILSLGDNPDGVFEIKFTVQNLTNDEFTYLIDTTALYDYFVAVDWDEDGVDDNVYNTLIAEALTEELVEISTDVPENVVTVPAGGSAEVTVRLELTEEAKETFAANYPNGSFIDGFVELWEAVMIESVEPEFLFDDVQDPSKFYYDPVYWAVAHDPQITNGTSETTFSPNKTCTRAQVVTFLWRAAGEPEPVSTDCPFTDVKTDGFYYKAMLWAVENGITNGTTATTFGPGKACTRAQVVTFLYRFAGEPEPVSTDCPFTDVKTDGFYYQAMLWAVENEITNGTSATTFSPGKACTRGQVVTFLYRLMGEAFGWVVLDGAAPVHVSFTGFFGDWTQGPILEAYDWRDIVDLESWLATTESDEEPGSTYADLGYTYLDIADFELNTDVNVAYTLNYMYLAFFGILYGGYAGDNLFDYQPFNEDHIAISPYGVTDTLYAAPMMLRNARHMIMVASDAETGEVYYVDDTEYLPKAVYDTDYGYWVPTGAFLYDGTDAEGEYLPGGTKVTIDFYANLAYGEDALGAILGEDPDYSAYAKLAEQAADYKVWSFPLTVDDAAPEQSAPEYDPETGTLTVTARDDEYLSAVGLYAQVVYEDEYGNQVTDYELLDMVGFSDEEPGQSHEVVFENIGPGTYLVSAMDYATNESDVAVVLGEGSEYVTLTFEHPAGCYMSDYVDVYYVSKGATVTVPYLESYLDEGYFVAWIDKPLQGTMSYDELEASGLVDTAVFDGTELTVTEDRTLYALFEYVSEWSDPAVSIRDWWEDAGVYDGVWAFSGFDWYEYAGDWFLDGSGNAVSAETEYDDEDGYSYLADPGEDLLFEIVANEDLDYTIRNLATGKYLSMDNGEIAFVDEPDAYALWYIYWDDDMETTIVVNVWDFDHALMFDVNTSRFCIVTGDQFDPDSQWLLLYGAYPLDYGYFTDPEALYTD